MSNLDPNRKINSLSDEEFERYWKAIEKNECWEVGEEDFIPKWMISGVHKKRGVITEYLVCINKESIWLSKQEAIKWTMEGIPASSENFTFLPTRKFSRLNDRKQVNIKSIWTCLRSFNPEVLARPKCEIFIRCWYRCKITRRSISRKVDLV